MPGPIPAFANPGSGRGQAPPCLHCHWGVGHGERAGLGGPLTAAELGAQPGTESDLPVQNAALEQR